ncbi:helix-turn-helix domain-containing protein [Allosalinactinospora lopnorensis]|uniref:helix-turn-helix domain-containing protein n=1 Tax=Allosalinactinospora lopnorensis TaxID=1352348 RepID=UPI000623FD01|nr:helix-turn-helix domain-containing protein [Allosalinactinospora lopnorensis]
MRNEPLDTALPAGVDPRQYARTLAQTYEAALAGRTPPAHPRSVIVESWRRLRRQGLDPDRGADRARLPRGELERRRAHSDLGGDVLATLRNGLLNVAEDAGHMMVIVDADGWVLWRGGSTAVRRRADNLGFVEGANWTEDTVGTNAIGTSLVQDQAVQVHSAEHYVRAHHPWTCAAAPVRDTRDGRLLGAIDVSGPAATVHPTTLALVNAVARLAEAHLREVRRSELDRLRAVAAPVLAKLKEPAVIADPNGWVAASSGLPPVDRLQLPDDPAAQRMWLPTLGHCSLEPVPGGVLLRQRGEEEAVSPARLVLDLRQPHRPTLTVHRDTCAWTHHLTGRHADLLSALARHRAGLSAAELADDLFGDRSRTVTVRAEISRLRKRLGELLDHRRPYRFREELEVVVDR